MNQERMWTARTTVRWAMIAIERFALFDILRNFTSDVCIDANALRTSNAFTETDVIANIADSHTLPNNTNKKNAFGKCSVRGRCVISRI